MLQAFTDANELAHSCIKKDLARSENDIASATARLRDFTQALNEATANYVLTGIGRRPEGSSSWTGWVSDGTGRGFNWFGYFKKLSHDMKRPFVFVYPYDNKIQFSRRRYTDPLIAQFLLIGTQTQHPVPSWERDKVPVSVYRGSEDWKVFFSRDARRYVDEWVEACRTDQAMRRALRLI